MGVACNNVIGGDYQNGDIKVKGLRADKIILVTHGLLGKKEVPIDKSTVSQFQIRACSHKYLQTSLKSG